MFAAFVVAAMLGQTAPGTPIKDYSLKCPQGHTVNFKASGTVYVTPGTQPARPPAPQSGQRPSPARPLNYGVADNGLMHLPKGKSWYGGNVATRPAVGATGSPPNRVHVTIIGSQVERDAARKDLEANPEFKRIAERLGDLLAVQDYGPENPLVKDVGLVDGGAPDIIVQTTAHPLPLYRAHSYPGSDVLVGEIRRADPRYDPSQDPDGTGGGGLDLSRFLELPSSPTEWAVVLGIGLVLWFLVKD